MIRPRSEGWPHVQTTSVRLDHVGLVVDDLEAEIARWRALGFLVSEPTPLLGGDPPAPLGQSSAHVVFENGYVELSSPVAGSGNHLEPFLARGEGAHIVVLSARSVDAAWTAVARRAPGVAPPRDAARKIFIGADIAVARFRWFPLSADMLPGALWAVVEHRTPELVFHPSLRAHPNGIRRIDRFLAEGRGAALAAIPAWTPEDSRAAPLALIEAPHAFAIVGATMAPQRPPMVDYSFASGDL
jgi:catechol 2,3-dioxygenase-like lactoylglutathione lyase family enzyme